MAFKLNSYPNGDALAAAAASAWLDKLDAPSRQPGNAPYTVALSGGRITKTFFAAIVQKAKARAVSFARIHFFWADERCVPPSDPESNYAMARELLFEPLKIPAGQVHRLRGEGPEPLALREAIGEITTVAPVAGGQPVLDMIFLGMGEDGHVASLFPGEPQNVMVDPAIYRAVTAVKPPPRRITLGYGAIVAAREVWALVSGAGKETALRESLAVDGRTPLARVLRSRRESVIFSDIGVAR